MLSLAVSDFNILLLNVLTASPEDFSVLEVPKKFPLCLNPCKKLSCAGRGAEGGQRFPK